MMLSRNKIIFESNALILHCLIKDQINLGNIYATLRNVGEYMSRLLKKNKLYIGKYSYKKMDKIARRIIEYDNQGYIVYSCLSLSILIHIYLCVYNIQSDIIIGTCILGEKVYSHAWVQTIDNKVFDYRYDDYQYKELKRINLMSIVK